MRTRFRSARPTPLPGAALPTPFGRPALSPLRPQPALPAQPALLALLSLLMPLALALTVTGCGSQQEVINRVQPNAIEKKLFDEGEWYTLATVIDADYGAPVPVGDASGFSRIRFEIQEDLLLARRTHEFIREAEGEGGVSGEAEANRVVAMYAIDKHFDIRREYNPVTGEELNVLSENDQDRPWHAREFMRVDWSKNLIEEPAFSVTGSQGGIKLTPFNYYEQNEGDDSGFAPRFDRDDLGRVSYFDVVNKYLAEPEVLAIAMPDGENLEIESCLLLSGLHVDCAPGEIAVRQAFMRVEDTDYEPALYSAQRMDMFGYFLVMRDGYDPDYGLIRDERDIYVKRHNIWQQAHTRDALGARVQCRADDECGGGGSYCDLAWGRANEKSFGVCTIAFREREVRPVVYHYSRDFPEAFKPDAQVMADGWDQAFRKTVASLRAIECAEQGEAGSGRCAGLYAPQTTDRVFQLCGNPVAAGEPAACGPEGTEVEVGDIRYNLLGWVPEPHSASPLGFGPSYADPLTGEIRSAAAFVYGAALDRSAAQGRDALALLLGDLDVETLQSTPRLSSWIRDQKATLTPFDDEGAQHVIDIDGDDAAQANADMNFDWITSRAREHLQDVGTPQNFGELMQAYEAGAKAVGRAADDLALSRKAQTNRSKLLAAGIEPMLIDSETKLRAGRDPAEELSEAELRKYSPLRGRSVQALSTIESVRRKLVLSREHCFLDQEFADSGLLGLVRAIAKAAEKGQQIEWYGVEYDVLDAEGNLDYGLVGEMIKHPLYQAVAAHEVGHTLGLRHNFSGSYDAVNYRPRYWELRKDGRMRPRAWDPMTKQEIDGRIREHQYSTVMDYGQNFIVTDAEGLGHYDEAAIKMGYGDLIEVFTDAPAENAEAIGALALRAPSGVLGRLDVRVPEFRILPYTEWPKLVGGVANLQKREDVPYASMLLTQSAAGVLSMADASGRPVVPYVYCGDEFANFQTHCLRYDAGADEYETMQSIIDSYWNEYPFSHFMRQRIDFEVDDVATRSYGRYLSLLESANRIYSRYRSIFGSLGLASDDFFEAQDGFGAYTLGVHAAYDLLRQIIAVPEPGAYVEGDGPSGENALVESLGAAGDFSLDSFEARSLRTGFDYGPDFSLIFLDRAGFFHDKSIAVDILTYSGIEFIGQDTQADLREFSTSFYTTFPDSVTEYLRGLLSRDWRSHAPRRRGGELVYPSASSIENHGLMTQGRPIDPNFAFSLELVAMTKALESIPSSFDQDFINRSRIFVRGAAEALEIASADGVAEFTDPRSGLTYVAPRYPGTAEDEDGPVAVETGIAASMIDRAIALEAAGDDAGLADWVDSLDFLRFLTWELGFGASGQALGD